MFEAVDPCLRIGLGAVNGADIVAFTLVIEGYHLGYGDRVSILHELLPTLRE
jgi:hypothetical protein